MASTGLPIGGGSTEPGSTATGLRLLEGVGRQTDYWATLWRRTWRGVVASSFLTPFLYVLAMGVLLGGFVDAGAATLEGASSYLAFVAPGLIAAHAMQTAVAETTYPVMGMIKWQRTYEGMLATPLEPRHVVGAHLSSVVLHLAATCAVYGLVMVPFGVYQSWWGPFAAFASQVLVGVAFATWVYGLSTRLHSEQAFGLIFRLGVFPLFLFSGAFFPVANLGEVGAWLARLTPLWHGVNLSRMFALDNVTWWVAAVNTAVLVALIVSGWFWSVSGLAKRMER
ncbi:MULTISPECIES: ABC transporter permease [Nocardioides]|uniref:ABC transporter permease n=1 Tax=Nocardioides vastitatis TaxID=2568655 RepID=A0ABW0ZLA1_9ACTN|nr:ABC transporter permease [Nocardioides sp.]THJ04453.1 ABC transporter [Nocardioides sp.]